MIEYTLLQKDVESLKALSMRCFTGVILNFSLAFFLVFFLVFLIPTCWYKKCKENEENMQGKRKEIFLYFNIHWVKAQASCIFIAFLSHFCLQTLPTEV